MLNSGEWFQEANKTQGEEVYQLLVDMHTEDQHTRPKITEVVNRLIKMNDDHFAVQEAEGKKSFDPMTLLSNEDNANH